MMQILARTFIVPAPLRIVFARMKNLIPSNWVVDDCRVLFETDSHFAVEDEAGSIDKTFYRLEWRVGEWEITAGRDRVFSSGPNGSASIWIREYEVIGAVGKTEEDKAQAIAMAQTGAMRFRLEDLERDVTRTKFRCEVLSVTEQKVIVTLHFSEYLLQMAGYVQDGMSTLWPITSWNGAAWPQYPTDEKDERLVSAMDEDSRRIVAYVNQRKTPAQIARLLGGEYTGKQINRKIASLRRRFPELVIPADQKRARNQNGSKGVKKGQTGS